MKKKQLTAIALAAAMAMGTFGFSVPVKADEAYSTEYEITIPSTLEVQNAGWNATTGITAKLGGGAAFDSSKKLTVTAASANDWALVSGNNRVGYNLATEGNNDSVYNNAQAEVPSWEFAADEITTEGKNKAMGIIVEDYSSKDPGTYQDTVTFTAKVEDAVTPTVLSGALVDGATIKVNFKWRATDAGDYVQGVYNASSGTFTVSKGGSYWGTGRRTVYKVEKSGDNIIIGAGYDGYDDEGMVWTFNTTNDTYTYTQGSYVSRRPDYYGLTSVTLNGTDITSQLTKN